MAWSGRTDDSALATLDAARPMAGKGIGVFLGHYGVAMAAKRLAPEESLGATVLGAQWLDLLWPLLLLLGLERVRIVPGLMKTSPLDFEHYPISHSLLAAAGWAAAVGAVTYLLTKRRRGAWLLAALVLSHWFLDLPMHRPDLPLWPGSGVKVGLGLWNSVAWTVGLEFALLAGGATLYLRTTRARDRVGTWGFWGGVAVLVAFYLGSFSGPPPSVSAIAWGGLTLWLFVPWAWWVDRHRAARGGAEASTFG